ncbi:MAG TPA: low affinity iron permease family protein [Burkholderiales bacterium]
MASAPHPFRFAGLARRASALAGRPAAFGLAAGLVAAWAASGPLFDFSNTWQLVINTTTTIVTFLMVFVIQSTQNRDTAAMQIKLDELIRATEGAHNALLDLEQLDERQLTRYLERYERLAAMAREKLRSGRLDTDAPEIKSPLGAAPR